MGSAGREERPGTAVRAVAPLSERGTGGEGAGGSPGQGWAGPGAAVGGVSAGLRAPVRAARSPLPSRRSPLTPFVLPSAAPCPAAGPTAVSAGREGPAGTGRSRG